jgi:hypothetical protein
MTERTTPDATDLKARLRADLAKIQDRDRPLPWIVHSGCSFRRIASVPTRENGFHSFPDGNVLSAYNQRGDGHPDLSMPEDQLESLVRLINAIPEAADALDAKDRTIAGLREAFLETRGFLSLLEPAVCDWSCPSKWRSGEPQPHSKLHHDLRDVLHKHETVAIALRDQRLARRMGAEFVPHDYDATPLKGQTP